MKAAEIQPSPPHLHPNFLTPLTTHTHPDMCIHSLTHTSLFPPVLMGMGPGPVTNPPLLPYLLLYPHHLTLLPLIAAVTGLVDKRQQSSGHHGKSSATILSAV